MYYKFIKDFKQVWIACSVYIGALFVILFVLTTLRCRKRLKYRMEFTYTDTINWFRWIFWGIEILYTPLLVNATWTGNCSFVTKREAIIVTECGRFSEERNERL
jgi:hypothetical protein